MIYLDKIYGFNLNFNQQLNNNTLLDDSISINIYYSNDKSINFNSDLFIKKLIKAPTTELNEACIYFNNKNIIIIYDYKTSYISYDFNISNRSIDIKSSYKTSIKNILALLYQPVLTYIVRIYNRVCLHSNTLIINNKTVAFMGESGAGKSTISAYFVKKGYRVFSDDVAVISKRENGYIVWRGNNRIKIHLKTALNIINKNYDSVFDNPYETENPKVYFNEYLGDDNGTAKELDIIYILKKRNRNINKPIIERLNTYEALLQLSLNRSNTELMEVKDKIKEFKFLSGIASSIPIKTLELPDSLDFMDNNCEYIIKDLKDL